MSSDAISNPGPLPLDGYTDKATLLIGAPLMSNQELFSHDDFPVAIRQDDNKPVEWTPESVAELVQLPPDELNKHIAQMLAWYVREDDVNLGRPGNEYWAAGFYVAKALLAAHALQNGNTFLATHVAT